MARSFSGQHVINIDELSASTRKNLEILRPLSEECCIYKVQVRSRQLNEHVYTPQVVSIGPIHYGKKKLRAMEEHKQRYLQDFLQLSQISFEDCFQLIQMNETRLRDCYADIIDLNSENFMEMVLLDATFLIMVFLRNSFNLSTLLSSIGRMFKKTRMMLDIRQDIVLLENQIPFFILEELFKLSKIQNILESNFNPSRLSFDFNEETAMIILAHEFLKKWNMIEIPERNLPPKADHILDLLRSCLIPADWNSENWNPERKATKRTRPLASVKELCLAGVRLRVGSKENMFNIRFFNGILEIPPLKVSDDTELVFRNLQAFEICHCGLNTVFIDYFAMMEGFSISSVDAKILIHEKVIENLLPNAESVSTLFRNISCGNMVSNSDFSYSDVITELDIYYDNGWNTAWNRLRAPISTLLKEKYPTPEWAAISVAGAINLLGLTLVQTICSILQVTYPSNPQI